MDAPSTTTTDRTRTTHDGPGSDGRGPRTASGFAVFAALTAVTLTAGAVASSLAPATAAAATVATVTAAVSLAVT